MINPQRLKGLGVWEKSFNEMQAECVKYIHHFFATLYPKLTAKEVPMLLLQVFVTSEPAPLEEILGDLELSSIVTYQTCPITDLKQFQHIVQHFADGLV